MLRSARILRWSIRVLQPKDVAHRQHMIDSLQVYVSMFSGPLAGGTAGIPWVKCVLTRHRLQSNYVEQLRTGIRRWCAHFFQSHGHGSMSPRPCVSRAHYLRHLWLITVSCSSGTSIRLDTTLCVTHPSTPSIFQKSCGPNGQRLRVARSSPRCSEQHRSA